MSQLKSLLLSDDPVGELWELMHSGRMNEIDTSLSDLVMDIPKGYGHKNVLDHSIRVLGNALEFEEKKDLTLRTAALFHDVGKPATREFHGKGKVTFTNHDVLGSKIVRKVLPKHGFSKTEVDEVGRLVYMHMRSHTFKSGWSESAVRRLSTQAGSDLQLERLIVVFKSDATTKFTNKIRTIHKNVDELSVELARVKSKDDRLALRPALNGNEVAELLDLKPGKELGLVMKFLNSDDGIKLSRDEAVVAVESFFKPSDTSGGSSESDCCDH